MSKHFICKARWTSAICPAKRVLVVIRLQIANHTMAKHQEGIVIELQEYTASVKTSRHNDCDNCGACPGNNAAVIQALNPINAQIGQLVLVAIPQKNLLLAAFVVYLLPIILTTSGIIFFVSISRYLHISFSAFEQTLVGGIFFALSLFIILTYEKYTRGKQAQLPIITAILR